MCFRGRRNFQSATRVDGTVKSYEIIRRPRSPTAYVTEALVTVAFLNPFTGETEEFVSVKRSSLDEIVISILSNRPKVCGSPSLG